MRITIKATDELTGNEIEVVVNDGTSTGLPSATKCQEMLDSLSRKYNAMMTYVSHSVVIA